MGFYSDRILPRCIDRGCGVTPVSRQREKVVPHAEGRILEVGMGSGLNIPFYGIEGDSPGSPAGGTPPDHSGSG